MTTPTLERRPRYPSDSTAKRTEYQRRYYKKNPWARKYNTSLLAASRKNLEHTMKIADFKELWFRDNASEMEKPSIDRIDRFKGYFKENCRFIELKENQGRDNRGRKNNKAQREAGRTNITNYNNRKHE